MLGTTHFQPFTLKTNKNGVLNDYNTSLLNLLLMLCVIYKSFCVGEYAICEINAQYADLSFMCAKM